jgi:hypothetical protein
MLGLPGRQRTIVDFEKNKLNFDETLTLQLFLHPEVKDRKIVSLSIVGAFRKGKVFCWIIC